MMEKLNVTAVQFNICWEDKAANFKKIEALFLNDCKPGQTDFMILPEMFATGFTMKPQLFWEDQTGPTVVWLKQWAQKLNCHIGGGIITKTADDQFRNTFVVVSPQGNTERYHKRHLFRMGEENKHYKQGLVQKIIEIKGWKINLQICYDLRFPVFVRNRIVDEKPLYDMLVYIANWPEVRAEAWTNLLKSRAIENQAFVVGVNRVGMDGNQVNHSGESVMINPNGAYVLNSLASSESIKTRELDYQILNKARQTFPLLLDADGFILTDN